MTMPCWLATLLQEEGMQHESSPLPSDDQELPSTLEERARRNAPPLKLASDSSNDIWLPSDGGPTQPNKE
jgi:hypothetical protein